MRYHSGRGKKKVKKVSCAGNKRNPRRGGEELVAVLDAVLWLLDTHKKRKKQRVETE